MRFGALAHEKVLRSLELLAREVMPRFRGLPAVVPRAPRDEVAATC
jgi:hypothetical protein